MNNEKREIKFRAWFSITDGDNSFSAMIPDVVVYPDQRLGCDFETFKNAIKSSGWELDTFVAGYFVRGEDRIDFRNSNISVWENEWMVFDGIPMQYTGLKDANGVEIYEGDIATTRAFGYYSIEWDGEGLRWQFNNGARLTAYIGWCEVRGNIYENHELLEVKK